MSLALPSTPTGRESFNRSSQLARGQAGPLLVSGEPPIPRLQSGGLFWRVLQSFCVFLSVDLFMMASYCLHWKLLTLASGRALSSEPLSELVG